MSGRSDNGFNALQIYQVTGQAHLDHTDLYFGTQDNEFWASFDSGATWPNDLAGEGLRIQVPYSGQDDAVCLSNSQAPTCVVTMLDIHNAYAARHFAGGPSSVCRWTDPPNHEYAHPHPVSPVLIGADVYAEWAHDPQAQDPETAWNLYLSANPVLHVAPACYNQADDMHWTPVTASPIQGYLWGEAAVAGPPSDPVIYQPEQLESSGDGFCGVRPGCGVGLMRISGIMAGNVQVDHLSVGNLRLISEGFNESAVFAVDPNDPQHLIAADDASKQMEFSVDGGTTWTPDQQLTGLVTGAGQFQFAPRNIAFDPNPAHHSSRIMVGTEAAGIISSEDDGLSWAKVPGSQKVTAVTSFFFDDVQNTVVVSSWGRGLWMLVPAPVLTQGDVNCDGLVNEADVKFLLEFAAGLNDGTTPSPCLNLGSPEKTSGFPWGDLNCDNSVNAVDALFALAFKAGILLTPVAGNCFRIGSVMT
jgi:hypothetical protein